jgi:hypothetical protein
MAHGLGRAKGGRCGTQPGDAWRAAQSGLEHTAIDVLKADLSHLREEMQRPVQSALL